MLLGLQPFITEQHPILPLVSAQCDTSVQQYVPMILAMVDNEVSVDKMCLQSKICPSEVQEEEEEEEEGVKGNSDSGRSRRALVDVNVSEPKDFA